MKSFNKVIKGLAVVLSMFALSTASAATAVPAKSKQDAQNGQLCISCHAEQSPGLVAEWKKSRHAAKKVNVDCYDCHQGKEGEKGVVKHMEDKAGKPFFITTLVSPRTCARCHEKEVAQQQRSHHAKGGEILASLDNIMGEVIGGPAAVNAGCRQCHGGKVELNAAGEATSDSWPNTGIGRLNPDGSRGSCSACHARHSFSSAQARTPDTCGKCHLGPDHPQMEIYNESKHGILYRAKVNEMNLDSRKWVAGVDYSAAPTCATCHMGATRTQGVTHDIGERISWTLRPPISTKLNMVRLANGDEFDQPEGKALPKIGDEAKGSKVTQILTWEDRRKQMTDVCASCHSSNVINGHYKQFDDVVNLYNDKFAKPIAGIMKELQDKGYITASPFDEKIEWTWYEIWHHEGRRARHGASMNGPDYTWWHGMYEVAQHTYFTWIPELREVVKKKDGNEQFADELLTKYFKPIDGHDWYFNGISKDAVEKVRKGFEERYGKGSMK